MRPIFVLTCLLLFAGVADAQVIYRCKGADGVVAVQSAPCPAGQRDLGARYYYTGTASAEALERRRQADVEMERRRRQQAVPTPRVWRPTGGDPRTSQRIQCELARSNRDRTLAAVGLRRTTDMLRQLNDAVWNACKGL